MFKKNKYELNDRKLSPHIFDNKVYNNINSYNNVESEYISPLKRSYDFSIKQNKSHLFQNENMTINKISPSHILFKPLSYDNGGYSNNYYENNGNNYFEKKNKNKKNYNYNKGKTTLNKKNLNQNYLTSKSIENNDDKYSDIYGFNKADENRYEYYLKNPYYKGEDIDDGYKHYNPEENSFKGSNYGGYIYNYYLNAPMRSDKTENWRFPPLYYFRPKYK